MKSFIWEAWQLVGSSGFGWTGATNENIKWITSESFIEEAIKNHNLRFFVSKIGDEIVAFCAIRRIDVGSIELAGIIVRQDYLCKGIGSGLFEKAKRVAVQGEFTDVG